MHTYILSHEVLKATSRNIISLKSCFPGNSPEDHKEREVIETENSQQESTPVHEQREKVEDKTDSADCGS